MIASAGSGPRFAGDALVAALDRERTARGMTWSALAVELWEQSAKLNERLGGDALCPGALYRTSLRGTMSCQYALPLLRWLDRAPEDFLVGDVVDVGDADLPSVTSEWRLRWDLGALYTAINERRQDRGLTWVAAASELDCTPNRITNLKTARLADMGLVMQATQWLEAPAARFIHATDW